MNDTATDDQRMDIRRPGSPDVLFFHEELACRATGVVLLAPGFAGRLAALRVAFGRPMRVTSCCRSADHNRQVGGHPRSLHVWDRPVHRTGGTAAIDIAVPDGAFALDLARTAIGLGWSVGVPRQGFLHLDRRDIAGLPAALFGYGG